jgi:Tol biopolymer transport system component
VASCSETSWELDSEPVYSNDGSRLAFVREVDGGSAVFAVDIAAGTVTRLTSSRHLQASGPAWSPDGTRILFEGDGRIWVTSTDGRGTEVMLPMGELSSAHGAVWRPPSGNEILFKGCQGGLTDSCEGASLGARLFLTAADGSGQPTAVSSADTSPNAWIFVSFDPSGQRVVSQRHWDGDPFEGITILTLDPGTLGAAEEERLALPDGAMGWAPRLSPDGTRAAIFVDQDATTNHRIGFVSIDDPDSLVLTGPDFDGGCWCEWSPDGEDFVVVHDNFRSILDPDGGPATTQPWIEDGAPGATWQRLAP